MIPETSSPLAPGHVLFSAAAIAARLDTLAAELTAFYCGKPLTVLAIMTGSLPFCADLLRRIPIPLRLECLSVASYHGGAESSGVVTFRQLELPAMAGRDVLILDDILDTGRTLQAVRRRLLAEASPRSVRVAVLLRKQKQRAEPLEADYAGFDIADEFVIGYGLDYDGRYRNLPDLRVFRAPLET
jgi:hypoxanthine phosphoribosyltransferase